MWETQEPKGHPHNQPFQGPRPCPTIPRLADHEPQAAVGHPETTQLLACTSRARVVHLQMLHGVSFVYHCWCFIRIPSIFHVVFYPWFSDDVLYSIAVMFLWFSIFGSWFGCETMLSCGASLPSEHWSQYILYLVTIMIMIAFGCCYIAILSITSDGIAIKNWAGFNPRTPPTHVIPLPMNKLTPTSHG